MKKTIWLILVVLIAGSLLYFQRTSTATIIGESMEPEFKQGDFLVFKQVLPQQVKEGDVIVFEVPTMIREQYDFPPTIAHRVIKITRKDGGITFNTKGDNNASPDPFTVGARDLKGTVTYRIPYFGNLFIFGHSRQGLIFIAILLILFSLYIYKKELSKMSYSLIKRIFSPTTEGFEEGVRRLEEREEETSQARDRFASAMTEYAKHLRHHTEAIQNLAKTAGELKKVASEHNKLLGKLSEIVEGSKERGVGKSQNYF